MISNLIFSGNKAWEKLEYIEKPSPFHSAVNMGTALRSEELKLSCELFFLRPGSKRVSKDNRRVTAGADGYYLDGNP